MAAKEATKQLGKSRRIPYPSIVTRQRYLHSQKQHHRKAIHRTLRSFASKPFSRSPSQTKSCRRAEPVHLTSYKQETHMPVSLHLPFLVKTRQCGNTEACRRPISIVQRLRRAMDTSITTMYFSFHPPLMSLIADRTLSSLIFSTPPKASNTSTCWPASCFH